MTAITVRPDHETRSWPVRAEQEFGRVSVREGDACAARLDLSVVVDLSPLTYMERDGYCGTVAVPSEPAQPAAVSGFVAQAPPRGETA